jgi:antitoxin CptB
MSDAMHSLIDARALSKLRWRCRRGLLENDLFVERFFNRHASSLTEAQGQALQALMELPDNDLLDLLLARKEPEGDLLRDDVVQVLRMMRAPQ